jgi:hypothetical protein
LPTQDLMFPNVGRSSGQSFQQRSIKSMTSGGQSFKSTKGRNGGVS